TVSGVRRVGKRIVLVFDPDLFLVLHLMIAGRLRWREPGKKPGMGPKMILASFEFAEGSLFFTEASSKKRASMQLVRGEAASGAASLKRSPRFTTRWRCTAASRSRARFAGRPCSALSMPRTSAITAHDARPEGGFSRIARCRGS